MDSDEETEVHFLAKRQKVVQYGSLEQKEKQRLAQGSDESLAKEAIKAGIAAGNINISGGATMDLEKEYEQNQAELLAEFEKRKRAKKIQVSTDDSEVKAHLRQLEEPICLFGEGPADRRERLRKLLAEKGEEAYKRQKVEEIEEKKKRDEENITWYHEGPESLKDARYWIAEYSIPRAKARVKKEKEDKNFAAQKTVLASDVQKRLRSVHNECSQIGDERPLSYCQFSPNGKMLAVASWSGVCKLWSVPDCNLIRNLRGHNCNVGAIVFHPRATLDLEETACCMASCRDRKSVV